MSITGGCPIPEEFQEEFKQVLKARSRCCKVPAMVYSAVPKTPGNYRCAECGRWYQTIEDFTGEVVGKPEPTPPVRGKLEWAINVGNSQGLMPGVEGLDRVCINGRLFYPEKSMTMLQKKSWDDFQKNGLLWWTNRLLQAFGWSIVMGDEVYPARTKFRGFDEKSENEGFEKVTRFLRDNASALLSEIYS